MHVPCADSFGSIANHINTQGYSAGPNFGMCMKKPGQRPQMNNTSGESRALYFVPRFRSGMQILIFLAFVMAMVSISFQHSRLAMTLLNTHLPEITMAVKALDEVPNDVKLPALSSIIHFLAINGDEGLNILHRKRPDKAFSTI